MSDRMPEYIQDMTKYMSWHDLTCHGGDHSKKSIFFGSSVAKFKWTRPHVKPFFLIVSTCQTWRTSRMKCSLWCSNMSRFMFLVFLFDSVNVSKLKKPSHEMLVLMLQHVSFCVSGFPLPSPCLWGNLQNLFLFNSVSVSKLEDVPHEIINSEIVAVSVDMPKWRPAMPKTSLKGKNSKLVK